MLREALKEQADEAGWELITAPLSLCTDNAVMGAIAIEKLAEGKIDPLSLNIRPGLVR